MTRRHGELDDTAGKHLERLLGVIRGGASAVFDASAPDTDVATDPRPVVPSTPPLVIPQAGQIVRETWELRQLVGKGGFGLVFTARHQALERDDALKFLHPHLADDEELRQRFAQEARVMAQLRGDHLVQVHDYGEHEGLPFFAMERLHGAALGERLEAGRPMARAQFERLAVEILQGVAEIHAHGIVHRDIKPDNIFVLADRGGIKMLDFGLAKTSMRLTARDAIMGTPLYMAPELLASPHADASVSTDLYSVGVVLHQMLTGRMPYPVEEGTDLVDFLQQVIGTTARPPRIDRPDVPSAVRDLVRRAIDRDPARRPQTADQMLDVLRAAPKSSSSVGRSVTASLESIAYEGTDAEARVSSGEGGGVRERGRGRQARWMGWMGSITSGAPVAVVAVVAVVALVAITLVFAVVWPWGAPAVFAESGGILVTAPTWASGELVTRYDALCTALRDVAEPRVHCSRVSRWNARPTLYLQWARASGASMVIHVGDQARAQIVPEPSLGSLPLFEILPALELRDPERIESLAPLLAVLPWAAESDRFEVPALDVDHVGYRWATIAALLRRLHAQDVTQEPIAPLRRLARCEGARDGVDEDRRLCDVAKYLVASRELEHAPICRRIEPVLRRLSDERVPLLAALGRLSLAECIAAQRPAEAASLALAALEDYHPVHSCALVNVLPLVPHLSSTSRSERALLARLASFDPAGCPGGADALARRAVIYRDQRRYDRAAADFYRAYEIEPLSRRYVLAWAEALLHDPLESSSDELLRAELRRELFADPVPPEELPLALTLVYLRWLVTREPSDARMLLSLREALPDGQSSLVDGACSGLRSVACPDDAAPCSLDLLVAPKSAAQRATLEKALGEVASG